MHTSAGCVLVEEAPLVRDHQHHLAALGYLLEVGDDNLAVDSNERVAVELKHLVACVGRKVRRGLNVR